MKNATQAILDQALRLTPVERAELIEALFRSFDPDADARIDAAWAEEAESRLDAFEAGQLTADSAENVFRRVAKP